MLCGVVSDATGNVSDALGWVHYFEAVGYWLFPNCFTYLTFLAGGVNFFAKLQLCSYRITAYTSSCTLERFFLKCCTLFCGRCGKIRFLSHHNNTTNHRAQQQKHTQRRIECTTIVRGGNLLDCWSDFCQEVRGDTKLARFPFDLSKETVQRESPRGS